MAVHPSATGTGNWFVVFPVTDQTRVACQVSAMGTATITVEASMDGTNADTVLTFAADKKIHTFPAVPGLAYRSVAAAYTSGSPVVKCTVSGVGQISVMP